MESQSKQRLFALDFTKGILVLAMVVYHWCNYFIGSEGFYYRYLRVITPSFICITGFLIGAIYGSRLDAGTRLWQRGLKLLTLFTLLNLGASAVVRRNYDGMEMGWTSLFNEFSAMFITADSGVAVFQVLVPISYLLMFCGLIWMANRFVPVPVVPVCLSLFGFVLAVDLMGVVIANVELIGIGCLGVFLGSVSIEKIAALRRRLGYLFVAYALYLVAVSAWNTIYPLQVVGVCLTLLLVFLFGTLCREDGWLGIRVSLLGRYSLLGYITQIVVLQMLLRLPWSNTPSLGRLTLSFVAVIVVTQVTAELVENFRAKGPRFDRLYRVVFA